MKILNWMARAEEVKSGGKQKAYVDTDKMVNRQIRKEERKRKKAKGGN